MAIDLAANKLKFLKYMELVQSCSPLTIKSYKKDLEQAFSDDFHPLNDAQILSRARAALTQWGPLSPASRNRKASTLKSFFNYLFQEKIITRNLSDLIHTTKVPKKIPNYISVDEAVAVLSCAENQDRLLFLLLYGGGLRISEACKLQWKQIDVSGKLLRILGKGNKERLVALPDLAAKELNQLRKISRNSNKLENYIWGKSELNQRTAYSMIRNLGIKSNLLKPLHPHALRHSFATHLLSSGANLRTLQELLGHQSLTATEKYTHIGVDQLARTMEKNHPLGSSLGKNEKPSSKPQDRKKTRL